MYHRIAGSRPLGDHRFLTVQVLMGLAFLMGCVLGFWLGIASVSGAFQACLARLLLDPAAGPVPFLLLIWRCVRWLMLLTVSGFLPIGLFIAPMVVLLRGALLAFTAASFTGACGALGLKAAFLLAGLPALFWAPALLVLSVQSFCSAWTILAEGKASSAVPILLSQVPCWGIGLLSTILEYWCCVTMVPLLR